MCQDVKCGKTGYNLHIGNPQVAAKCGVNSFCMDILEGVLYSEKHTNPKRKMTEFMLRKTHSKSVISTCCLDRAVMLVPM